MTNQVVPGKPPMVMLTKQPAKKEPAWLGFDSMHGRYLTGTGGDIPQGVIASNETVYVIERVHVLFKSERLFVKHTCAPSFFDPTRLSRQPVRRDRELEADHRRSVRGEIRGAGRPEACAR